MNNSQLYPFERNRYYSGKMLTSNDFMAEQTYFNNKRRFINNLMYGTGVVCGLGVFSLDDLSIMVESGVAIDELGREIVVESSVVKKLSAIEGFDSLQTNDISLCLQYTEEPVHSVYAVNQKQSDNEYEYNRIAEGFKLFLMDNDAIPPVFEVGNEFLTRGTMFENEDFKVEMVVPATVSKGHNAKLIVMVTKLSAQEKTLSYSAVLQTPNFENADGEHEIEIELNDIALEMGESIQRSYWFSVQEGLGTETAVIIKSGTAKALIDDEGVPVISGFQMKLVMTEMPPRQIINQEIGRTSLEMKNVGVKAEYIRIAELELVRTDSAYIISNVKENGIKNYIAAPAQEVMRDTYMDFFTKSVGIRENTNVVAPSNESIPYMSDNTYTGPEIASGSFEIPLAYGAKRGDVSYSNEIMHGLGKGNVYVSVGFEYVTDDPALGTTAKNTIYGEPGLFAEEDTSVPNVTTAVKVNNDKGSFVAAARLEEDADCLILEGTWVAIKFPSGSDLSLEDDYSGMSITAETPTVVLGTKDSHYFGVKFNNMEQTSVEYELTELGSGEITPDGVYTAPSKEGVYEIRITCVDAPSICTYAYAIVKKKGFEDEN